jgi:hypothetical protein
LLIPENTVQPVDDAGQVGDATDVEPRYKKTYTRFNSPFWQVVIVSFVAFGFVPLSYATKYMLMI